MTTIGYTVPGMKDKEAAQVVEILQGRLDLEERVVLLERLVDVVNEHHEPPTARGHLCFAGVPLGDLPRLDGMEMVRVSTGDTDAVPYGGGTWASRGAGIGGETALQAALAQKANVLQVAAAILQSTPDALDIAGGAVVDASGPRIAIAELARTVYLRSGELPPDVRPELVATRHHRVTDVPFVFTNGSMAAHVEVDIETGMVAILGFWAAEDCGRVINPALVDAQVRGGIVQGIGGALYEECLYDAEGQMLNATMADYLVPMAVEMPDIVVAHVETPSRTSLLGAKGCGEAGTGGAPGALMNAINDALRPLGAAIHQMPMTPERILKALGTV